jgi:hypothetical protein
LDRIVERSKVERLSTRVPLELAGTARRRQGRHSRQSEDSERASERGGPKWSGSDRTSMGVDPFGLTSGPRGILDSSELV